MKCPICKKIAEEKKYFPFCSLRCSELDLYKWLNQEYSVPAEELDEADIEEIEKISEKEEEEN